MEKCEMCGEELHTITTRRIGEHQFCRVCGDLIQPHIDVITEIRIQSIFDLVKDVGVSKARVALSPVYQYINKKD